MDDLDDLLSPAPRQTIDPARRDELGDRTTNLVRRRRVVVIARRVLTFAACYAAGIATFWFVQSNRDNVPEQVVVQPRIEPAPSQPPDPFRNDRPDILERWAAMATGDRRVELYRRAGDRFLERGSEAAALRCYRHSLDSSRPDDLTIRATEDTWLLMSLKMARQKEGNDVRN